MGPFMMTTSTFQGERPVFLREQANKMYTVFPYYIAKVLSDIPVFLVVPMIFTLITFFSIGFTRQVNIFFGVYVSLAMNTLAGVSLGYLISSAFTNASLALAIAPVLAMPLMLVGGFFANSDTMPSWIQYFSYVSPFKYAFNNIAKLEFSNNPAPAATLIATQLAVEDEFYEGIYKMCILIASIQILSYIFLRLLVSKFQ